MIVSPLWVPCDPRTASRGIASTRAQGSSGSVGWIDVAIGVPDVLESAAGESGVVVDLRSPSILAMGRPWAIRDRIVALRVEGGRSGRHLGDVIAKRVRGEAARYLLESGELAGPRSPRRAHRRSVAGAPRSVDAPERSWTLTLSVTAASLDRA